MDLKLAKEGRTWPAAAGLPIRPGAQRYSYTNTQDRQKKIDFRGYTLGSQSFVLGWTEEYIDLPISSRIAARVEGKSSLARLGVGIHVTAPTIHAGFKGNIQLEIFNFGPNEIILDAGLRICQLIFEQTVGTPEKGYSGMFANQRAEA